MKQLKRTLFISLLSTAMMVANAQQVISTAGGYFEGDNISLSWTLGEPVIETFEGNGLILTQGFQQPYNFYLTQILNIPAGWSGVSVYLDPLNKGVESLFAPFQGDLIIMASMDGVYYPAQSINTIGNWDYHTGYQLKAENEFDLSITGTKINDPSVEIAAGWNFIPVLSACNANVESLFAGYTGLIMVKEVAGSDLYWPAFNINSLQNLLPGKAYVVATEQPGSITFQDCDKSSIADPEPQKPKNNTPWNDLYYTNNSHVIAFSGKVFDGAGICPGDMIGVFTPCGLCVGTVEVTNLKGSLALTAFADDAIAPGEDGFETGDRMQFKVYRPGSDEEFELDVTFDPALPNLGIFEPHGISAVQALKLQALGMSEEMDFHFEVYP
nr:hypothetical protein [Bacteroidota bacterium]